MIRGTVIKWALIALLALFAFMLLPAYEYFTPNEPIASTLGVVPLSMKKGMGGEAPVCSWETKEGKAPKDKPKSYLTGMEYKVLEKAKIDCSMDSSCRGVLSRTKNGNMPNYYLMSTDTLENYTGSGTVTFHKKKAGCTKDPLDPPCEWGEPQKDMAPKNDTLNYFFPTMYTAQIGCAERDDCVGITKDDETNFYYLANDYKLREKKGKTFYKKRKCHKDKDDEDDEGGGGSGSGGSCSWPTPMEKRQIKGGQTALIPAPPFNSRAEAEKECAKKPECKGVARFGDWFGLSKTTETSHNEGPFDFTEKPSGCSGQSDYSPGSSTSWPPVDDIMDGGSGKADKSDGTRAGAGYGPGAMYGNGKHSRPWFQGSEEDNYIAKSALVPCTCTTHSMGCTKHAGGREYSKAPGDMDGGGGGSPDQYGIMKPFSKAFENQEEPSGFLNAFNAFMK